MGSSERTILRIRCSKVLFRRFKKVAADFKDYEEALDQIMDFYAKHAKTFSQEKGVRFTVPDLR